METIWIRNDPCRSCGAPVYYIEGTPVTRLCKCGTASMDCDPSKMDDVKIVAF